MTSYSINEIAQFANGSLIQGDGNTIISNLAIDSRKIINASQTLFFAIKTSHANGHDYIKNCYEAGVRSFVVSDLPPEMHQDAHFIKVTDTLVAMQDIARVHRNNFTIPIIGITGSNGKTIIKEWLAQLLLEDFNIVRTPKSYNSQVGVPLSIWQISKENDLGIFEAGISQVGEMEKLQTVIDPSIGIFTNIGQAHDEGFMDRAEKVQEKLKLFKQSELVLYCKDHTIIHNEIVKSRYPFKTLSWAKEHSADLKIQDIKTDHIQTIINATFGKQSISIQIPFTDEGSIENAIHCWLLMLHFKVNPSEIQKRMQRLAPVGMRLELVDAINNCTLINDSYNSDLESIKVALDFLNQQNRHQKKAIILSDVQKSREDERDLYQQIAALIREQKVYRLIAVGEQLSSYKELFGGIEKVSFYATTKDLLAEINEFTFRDEAILLKGARRFRFEEVGKLLEQKTHNTYLEVDLNAISHNIKVYKSLLKPSTRMMVMVKAFSYGSGSYEIANLLKFNNIDYLAVAYIDEGIELRNAGVTLPIMVMNPVVSSLEKLLQYNLEPEIYSMSTFKELLRFAKGKQINNFPIHLKLDTGMHRLGFSREDLSYLMPELNKSKELVKIKSVFSHLATSDNDGQRKYSEKQIALFAEMVNKIKASIKYPFITHILNSVGIVNFPDIQIDMVRLGLGLYGIDITGKLKTKLQNVSTLKSTIAQIKTVNKDEGVGYGRSAVTKKETKIATVNIGYADGLDRRFGNGNGYMLINSKKAFTIGNICMDMTMLDITDITDVSEGDEVIIFGQQPNIEELADIAGTIPYELLTNISRRVKRVYFQE